MTVVALAGQPQRSLITLHGDGVVDQIVALTAELRGMNEQAMNETIDICRFLIGFHDVFRGRLAHGWDACEWLVFRSGVRTAAGLPRPGTITV